MIAVFMLLTPLGILAAGNGMGRVRLRRNSLTPHRQRQPPFVGLEDAGGRSAALKFLDSALPSLRAGIRSQPRLRLPVVGDVRRGHPLDSSRSSGRSWALDLAARNPPHEPQLSGVDHRRVRSRIHARDALRNNRAATWLAAIARSTSAGGGPVRACFGGNVFAQADGRCGTPGCSCCDGSCFPSQRADACKARLAYRAGVYRSHRASRDIRNAGAANRGIRDRCDHRQACAPQPCSSCELKPQSRSPPCWSCARRGPMC